jgi:hypothetical protein
LKNANDLWIKLLAFLFSGIAPRLHHSTKNTRILGVFYDFNNSALLRCYQVQRYINF